ncbi:ROK family protein [Lentzea sp. NBC_00516]|uniref:ROK family protein n=1 Tax=Lentzea sp. NBC_00516 TaxID=2903582 RepID=UPI002E8077DD|nr:ROK family protein [Lentzea sp. NBC_00516]WUD27345.1 ROK family protein [Lentzea sp. NBC_00516]
MLDNDATAAVLGEHWSGGMGSASTSAALYMGSGIGAGIVIGGITYRGSSGNAGEIGHMCVDITGPECWCGARGCVEALAGPVAVVAAARANRALAHLVGAGGSRNSLTAEFAAVSRAARRGEPQATAILERSARYVAVATRTLANVMDVEFLVLTGPGFAIAGSVYLPIVREELDRGFFARGVHKVEVRLSHTAATAPCDRRRRHGAAVRARAPARGPAAAGESHRGRTGAGLPPRARPRVNESDTAPAGTRRRPKWNVAVSGPPSQNANLR